MDALDRKKIDMFTVKILMKNGDIDVFETKYYRIAAQKNNVVLIDDSTIHHHVKNYERIIVENGTGKTVTNLYYTIVDDPKNKDKKVLMCNAGSGAYYLPYKENN